MPRFRFTIRRMMVAVAIVGCALGVPMSLPSLRRDYQAMPRDEQNAMETLLLVTAEAIVITSVLLAFARTILFVAGGRPSGKSHRPK